MKFNFDNIKVITMIVSHFPPISSLLRILSKIFLSISRKLDCVAFYNRVHYYNLVRNWIIYGRIIFNFESDNLLQIN